MRGRWRRLALGLPTVLGLTPRGWFIPHRYAPLLPPPGAQPPYAAIEALFEREQAQFASVLDAGRCAGRGARRPARLLDQAWFPSLDAAVAYALVRERKPRRIVEVGSGHSTRVLARALCGVGEILAIDPDAARRHRRPAGRAGRAPTLQAAPADAFDGLQAGRRAVHRFQPYPDAGQRRRHPVQSRAAAPAGRRAGAHSRHLPAVRLSRRWGWRNYNEQQGVLPLLTTGAYAPLFSSVWAERRLGDRLAQSVVAACRSRTRRWPPACGWKNAKAHSIRRCLSTGFGGRNAKIGVTGRCLALSSFGAYVIWNESELQSAERLRGQQLRHHPDWAGRDLPDPAAARRAGKAHRQRAAAGARSVHAGRRRRRRLGQHAAPRRCAGRQRQRDPSAEAGTSAPRPSLATNGPGGIRATVLPTAASGVAAIRAADPSFDPIGFADGARAAFTTIVEAFAKGETGRCARCSTPQTFASFEAAIRGRNERHEKAETTLIGFEASDIAAAELQGSNAQVTVRFVSEQINVVRNAEGQIADGNPNEVQKVVDLWTFRRDTKSSDPNWLLVKTESEG